MLSRLFATILFFCSLGTFSQGISFDYLTSEDGISQSEVYCFLHDSKGYVWFGTLDGLNKYNRYEIQTFKTDRDDPNSLMHNTVYALAEDQYGRIWIGTYDGLNVYDSNTGKMFAVPNFLSGSNSILKINSLLADGNSLWIGTHRGLFRMAFNAKPLNDHTLSRYAKLTSYVDIEVQGRPSIYASIPEIIKSKDGKIWLATWQGLCCFEYENSTNQYKFYNLNKKTWDIKEIKSIVEDEQQNIWVGTVKDGLYQYNIKTENIRQFRKGTYKGFVSDQIRILSIGINGDLWIGTTKDGLMRLKDKNIKEKKYEFDLYQNNSFHPNSINSNLIRSIYVSRDGLVWIGTIGDGINIYNPNKINFGLKRIPPFDASGKVNNFIRSIYPDKKNNIWLGLHNGGLVRYNISEDRFIEMGLEDYLTIFDIYPKDENHLWVASSKGALLLKLEGDKIAIKSSVTLPGNTFEPNSYNATFNIEESKYETFWVAALSGIARVKVNEDYQIQQSFFNVNSEPALSFDNVRVVAYDSVHNVLWAGTEGGGLNRIFLDEEQNPVKVEIIKNGNTDSVSLSSNYVRSLCLADEHHLWVGTYEGLNLITMNDNDSFSIRTWKEDDGLSNNMIQSIELDQQGDIWLGTNGGISRYIRDEDVFYNYYISEGLQSNEFAEHASFFDGELLYFAGINGFNMFDPEKVTAKPVEGGVRITSLYLANKKVGVGEKIHNNIVLKEQVDQTSEIVLKPSQNDLRLEFAALSSADPYKINYAYKLEGYDEQWIERDAMNRTAQYTNLPYGNYKFMVKAANSEDVWNVEPTELYIYIKTPVLLRWWALIIYTVLFLGGVYYFTRYSVIRIATKEKLILENDHNQRIHNLDMQRTRFFINVSHDLRTPLTLIKGPVSDILKGSEVDIKVKRKLELVERNVKRLLSLVEQILDVRKIETGKLKPHLKRVDIVNFVRKEAAHFEFAIKEKGLDLNLICPEESIITFVDPDMLGKALFNLISNSMKYTEAGKIEVEVNLLKNHEMADLSASCDSEECIRIDIRDTGKGMSEAKLEKVFERFYMDPDNRAKGYGIGLSHCKELILAQSGHISVESEVGKGTTISVFIPITKVENSSEQHMATVEPAVEKNKLEKITDDAKIPKEAIDGDIKTILIIDDNEDLRTYLRSGLEETYNIEEAGDGKQGLERTASHFPDLIVCDIMMPVMDGVEFCKQIKSNVETSHIPVILLTARTDSDIKYKGIESGADDYIPKPFEIDYLILRIKNILDVRESFKKAFRQNVSLEPSEISVTSADEDFLKKLMQILEDNLTDSEFTVEMLEKEVGLSHTHFYRKIKSLTGQTGKELLQNIRLKRAAQLLAQDKLRVSEIAYKTGFNNPKYFSKCFKEKYGVVPSAYIKKETE